MAIKIATYAICKDEIKHLKKWIENMWCGGDGTDGLYVLDTGSTDGTYEELLRLQSKYPQGWLNVEQKIYSPWRFDTPRNDNMAMIPEGQYDVYFCIDLDELVIEDFWADLRATVEQHPDFESIYYQYAWQHDTETDAAKWYFWYCKAHSPQGWKWLYPVHEFLYQIDKQESEYKTYYMSPEKIYLHHYPDFNKSRGNYLDLLELRVQENPSDLFGLYYLAREYSFVRNWEKCIQVGMVLYTRLLSNKIYSAPDDDMKILIPAIACLIGRGLEITGLKEDAMYFYKRAMQYGPNVRDGYIRYAQAAAYMGQSEEAYKTLGLMECKTIFIPDWRLVQYYWRDWKRLHIIGVAKSWEGQYEECKRIFDMALKDIKTEDDRKEAAAEGFFYDYDWVVKKLEGLNNYENS